MGWDVDIDAALRDIGAAIEDEVKEGAKVGARYLVLETPVRTGQLRGGWQPGINADPPFSRPPDDKTGEITIAYMEAVIEQYRLGDELVFTNYTPHGIYINDGTEKITPRRMVERTVDLLSDYFGGL